MPTDEQQNEKLEQPPQKRRKPPSASEKKMYKAKFSYTKEIGKQSIHGSSARVQMKAYLVASGEHLLLDLRQ